MEFGNAYEVFEPGDLVKIIDSRLVYYGWTGTIVQIEDISYNTEPIYTVRLDEFHIPFFDPVRSNEIKVNAKGLEKIQLKKERKFMERGTDEMKKLDVKKIIFSGPKTIVLWSDGTKTIVSMSKDELRFDPEAAFCAAYTKKMFGSNSKIKRIIEQKSNFEEYTKATIENAETEFDKFMKCICPWLYTEDKPTEVEASIAKAMSEFYKEELAPKENKDDEN